MRKMNEKEMKNISGGWLGCLVAGVAGTVGGIILRNGYDHLVGKPCSYPSYCDNKRCKNYKKKK